MRPELMDYLQAHGGRLPETPAAWVEAMNAARPFTVQGVLDIRFVAVDDESVTVEMPITDAARQPLGMLHGGVSLLLAETAASAHATWKVNLLERMPVGVEVSGSHLRAAREGTVVAVARVVQRGRHFVVHEVEIRHKEQGKLLSLCRVRNFYRPLAAREGR